jgi:KDO2-lipid IV(A) lauroyltransferase
MASRSRILNGIYRAFFAIWVPGFRFLVRRAPMGFNYAIARGVSRLFLRLRPKYEKAIRENLAQVLGEAADSPRVRDTAARMVFNHMRYWVDFFTWSERGAEEARAQIRTIENGAVLEQCAQEGKGVIALTAHLGNWELGGLLLGEHAGELAVVYVPDRFEMIEEYRSAYRRKARITEIAITDGPFSAVEAMRVLRGNGVLAVQGDRDFNGQGVPMPFFGRTANFPPGPAILSMLSGAPIVPLFILREPDVNGAGTGGFRIVVGEAIEPRGSVRDKTAVAAVVRRCVTAIEKVVSAYPDQWYCFYPFWNEPTGAPAEEGAGHSAQDDPAGAAPRSA